MSDNKIEKELKKSLGLLDSLNLMAEEVESKQEPRNKITKNGDSDIPDINSIFEPADKIVYIGKGFTLREDQVKKLEKYSKQANKKESEFIRDIIDYVFSIIENEA